MFRTIAATIPRDPDFPDRCWWIDVRTRLLNGTFYDGLTYDFHQETRGEPGQYVPIAERRPCVRTGLLRSVVDDSVSLLFDEDHWPALEGAEADKPARDRLTALAARMRLNETMMAAATVGAVGSVCLLLRILKGGEGFRPFVQVMNTMYLTMRTIGIDLEAAVHRARQAGVQKQQVLLTGLGFGKRREQNSEIIAKLGQLRAFDLPIAIGPSRKSFLKRELEWRHGVRYGGCGGGLHLERRANCACSRCESHEKRG